MAMEKFFAQLKPLQLETDALKKTLEKMEGEAEEFKNDKELYISYLNLKADVLSRLSRILEIKKEMESVMDKIENPTLRTLLRHRYINGETAEKTAEYMGYELRHVYRLQKKAVKALEEATIRKHFS